MKSNFLLPRPFFPIAIAFISGITLSDYFSDFLSKIIIVILGCFIVLFITGFIFNRLRKNIILDIILIILCFLAGSARLLIAYHYPANHISNFKAENASVYLEGMVIDEPLYYQPKNEFTVADNKLSGYFVINTKILLWADEKSSVNGKVRVSFYGLESADNLFLVKYGNRVRILGRIYSTRGPTNPGEFNHQRFLKRQDIYKTIQIKSAEDIEYLSVNEGNTVWNIMQHIRKFLGEKIDIYFDSQQASLIKALLLGNRSIIPDTMENQFMQTGTIHYLSVSGLHLAMLTGFFFIVLGLLGIKERKRAVVLIISAVLYALLTGLSTPISRSLVMIVIYLGAEIFNRKSNSFNSLALAALIIMLYNPQEVFSAGFQLSFISVLSIISLTPSFLALVTPKTEEESLPAILLSPFQRWMVIPTKKYLLNSVAVSMSACIGVFLIVLYYFHIITPIAVITNIILSPLIFLIMVFGFISLPFISLGIYSYLNPLISFLTEAVVWTVDIFSWIPFAYFYLPDIPHLFIWVFYGLFFLWLIRQRLYSLFFPCVITRMAPTAPDEVISSSKGLLRPRWARNDIIWVSALIIMILWFLTWAFRTQMVGKKDGLILTMLDVRQGASFIMETPDGKTIIYDAGTMGSRDIGEQVVTSFLWEKGITRIDTIIFSHPHLDHINGIQSILERFPVKKVLTSPYFNYSEDGRKMLKLLDSYQIPVEQIVQGNSINIGSEIVADVLGPPLLDIKKYRHINQNDLSLVLRISYCNKSPHQYIGVGTGIGVRDKTIILCGDIQATGIDWLIQNNRLDLKGDILQIPHHGLAIKSDPPDGEAGNKRFYIEELIKRINPGYALINSDEGKIDDNIIEICNGKNIDILTTSQFGAVTIKITADKMEIIDPSGSFSYSRRGHPER
ncbi:MAG: ComEC/Rec2 family competence protein [Planctomycetota bacterium]